MSESTDPRQRATAARQARERRIHELRRRVAAVAVAVFVAAWAGIFLQLVSGHDPALAHDLSPVATQSADPDTAADDWSGATASDDTTSADGADSTATSSAQTQSSTPGAVTTRQS
jgi:cytoskeletal protein RodZ